MKKKLLSIVFLILGVQVGFMQRVQDTGMATPEIKVIARAQQDKILLRWGVNDPLAWRLLNTNGYNLERYTISRDGKTLLAPEKVSLTNIPFTPEPLEQWENSINTNDNAAIVAQAIYGERFQVTTTGNNTSATEAIVMLSEEQQQRFTFTLFAADQDFDIAKKAGLGFVDTTAKKNEKYLYKITSNVPQEKLKIKEGGVFVGIQDYQTLPTPKELVGVFNDENVILSWNYKLLSKTYNSYYVQRSLDGVSFKNINEKAYTSFNRNEKNKDNKRMFFVDSISNNKKYFYRIKGVSSFGEVGPPSDVISGEGKSVLAYVPHLITKEFIDENTVTLSWEFPKEGTKEIVGFELNRANTEGGEYEIVANTSPQARKITYNQLKATNYFKITALGVNNTKRESFPMLVQPVDSIPPSKPVALQGTIDSTGVVKIKWKANSERDLLGYRIYRGNKKNEEFSQLTKSPFTKNEYVDTVKVKNLNKNVYYKVIAVDQRYNLSKSSEVLVIKKPDFVPPTSPVFTKYTIENGKIFLSWEQSSSEDVIQHLLFRKQNTNKDWVLIREVNNTDTSFVDDQVLEGNMYSYTLLAKDDSGLESPPSPPVTIMVPKTSISPGVKGFWAQVNTELKRIELFWRYKEQEVSEFEIYKSETDSRLQLWKVVPAGSKRITDADVSINTTYQYAIRAVFKDGSFSEVKKTTIKY